jgi:hypothetical protein
MQRPITSTQRKERRIPFRINESGGTPVVEWGKYHLTVTDGGVGIYTLTLTEPGTQTCLCLALPAQASRLVSVGTCTISTVQILVTDLSGTAADGDVHGEIIAYDAADQT